MMGPPAGEGDCLIEKAGRAQKVAILVERPAEPLGGAELLEAAHRTVAPFDPSVILFQHIIFVLAGAMLHTIPEFLSNGCRIAGVAIGRDLLRLDLSDRSGG